MIDRVRDYVGCLDEPERWAIATVTSAAGSGPTAVGTSMAVRDDATIIGSISAGCIEAAVVDTALADLAAGRSSVQTYREEDPLAVTVTCGGEVEIVVQPLTVLGPALRLLADDDAHHPRLGLLRPLDAPFDQAPIVLDLAEPTVAQLEHQLGPGVGDSLGDLRRGGVRSLPLPDCGRWLFESRRSSPTVIIYGANDYADALARAAVLLDRYVVVCDPRPIFATRPRMPAAHEVVVRQPVDHLRAELAAGRADHRTAVVVLTHQRHFSLPVLDLALRSGLGYVGAMGSRETHEQRAHELLDGGLPPTALQRLHSPIGLNLGAATPAEVAVSVLAELMRAELMKEAGPRTRPPAEAAVSLKDTVGPVHDPRVVR